ncbi:MAG: TSUP family transporter [Clostridia bacterium]|nr:TSUP family transporter [Clostridia bacterium]
MAYVIGLFAGLISGFFGTGGGLLIHPALTSILKLDEYKARGTTLITVFPAVLVASIFYANYNYFDLSIIVNVVIGGSIGGFIGAKLMKRIPKFWLAITFDIFLVIASIKMIVKG